MKHRICEVRDVSRETLQRLHRFEELLLRWNSTINLVSRGDVASLWQRHFEDCLQLVPLLPVGARAGVDLGSGAGFPGLVLAIASDVHFDLIESDHRKAAFLREAVAVTSAPATVHASRIEFTTLDQVDVLTARALAPVSELLALGARFLKPAGTMLLLKGARADQEIQHAAAQWRMSVTRHKSITNPEGQIFEISGISRAVT